jgi:hypothetical protein
VHTFSVNGATRSLALEGAGTDRGCTEHVKSGGLPNGHGTWVRGAGHTQERVGVAGQERLLCTGSSSLSKQWGTGAGVLVAQHAPARLPASGALSP